MFANLSCCCSDDCPEGQPADGAILLEQVKTAQVLPDELHVQPVACLWNCSRACVVAFSAPDKPTYLFSTIDSESATALLEFGERYVQSKTGNVPYKQFPKQLP